ncbi:hypothetical protein ROHU_002496 [Labeo rohita]|uniref:Uncharacterized protein n=1 Tax=Labeo rohita TaxID=84645 RepID=A0A498NYG1_LABRO|nr:hypothetical protein ROHU_002496 [Labeo rohita]
MVALRLYATELPGKKSSSYSSQKDEDRSRLAASGRTLAAAPATDRIHNCAVKDRMPEKIKCATTLMMTI